MSVTGLLLDYLLVWMLQHGDSGSSAPQYSGRSSAISMYSRFNTYLLDYFGWNVLRVGGLRIRACTWDDWES